MLKKRKTKAERYHEALKAQKRAWEDFEPKLAALQTYDDAVKLVADAPSPDSPGRRFYSNLGFFLGGFTVPMGSNGAERLLYMQFIKRLDAAGALKPGGAEKVLNAFQKSMREHRFHS